MADAIKGFFLLIFAIVGLTVAYVTWLVLIPVTESDAQFRLSNVCYGGQLIGSALNGAQHRAISCDCVSESLVKSVGLPGTAKGADAVRQLFIQAVWREMTGEEPVEPDQAMMADRDVLNFMSAMNRVDKTCAIGAFSSTYR